MKDVRWLRLMYAYPHGCTDEMIKTIADSAKVVKYISECREMNIQVLPPDVNRSFLTFTPDKDAIRFGLGAIKNVGGPAVESIVNARTADGDFKSLYDFCERVDLSAVNRRILNLEAEYGTAGEGRQRRVNEWLISAGAAGTAARG